ncbi:MAG: glycosyltransferase [Cyanobacteria bacterium P01_G01_bin.39]
MRNISLHFVIVNYNSSNLISRLLGILSSQINQEYNVLIVNNSPEDRELLRLKNDTINIIQAEKNIGFGQACNLGLNWIYQHNNQAIIWLINPDTYFNSDTIDHKISPIDSAIAFFKRHPQISILGTTVYNSQGELTDAGGTFDFDTAALSVVTSLPENIKGDYLKTDWVSGCSLLINLANFPQCPNFDPRYFLYYEDLDFCLRYGQQGHQIAVTHLIKVMHETSSITNRNLKWKYQHITHSYLIHIEKYGSLPIFIMTNIRMSLNTLRLILFKPQQGMGKLIGMISYWQERIIMLKVLQFLIHRYEKKCPQMNADERR